MPTATKAATAPRRSGRKARAGAQLAGEPELFECEDRLVQRRQRFAVAEPGLEAPWLDQERALPCVSGFAMGADIAQRFGQAQQRREFQRGECVRAPVDGDCGPDVAGVAGRIADPQHGFATAARDAVGVRGGRTGSEDQAGREGDGSGAMFQSFNEGHLGASGSERMTSC